MGPLEPYTVYPADDAQTPKPATPDPVPTPADQPTSMVTTGASFPPPIFASAIDDHDPTPCPYMMRAYRQMGPRDPSAVMHPADFPPLQPEPAAADELAATESVTPRRASPTAVFAMAQDVRRALKAQGVGTRQISLIADLLRQAQDH